MKGNGKTASFVFAVISGVITIGLLIWVICLCEECPASKYFMLPTIPMFVFWGLWIIGHVRQCFDMKCTDASDGEAGGSKHGKVPKIIKNKRIPIFEAVFVTAFSLAASIWWTDMLAGTMRYHEYSVAEKDMQILASMNTAAISASMQSSLDKTESYVITFTENGFEIWGERDGVNAQGLSELKSYFSELTSSHSSPSLSSLRERMESGRFCKLSSLVITIDLPQGLVRLNASAKGREPLEITSEY